MRPTPCVLLALLVGSVSHAEQQPTETAATGSPLSFDSSELKELAGTWGEPFRALMVMPGVSQVVSGASLPVVRGAAPSSTGFYLEGVRVPRLNHLWVGPSTLHPELVSGLDFHRGPAPARFGRELGGTVNARLLPPSTETVHAVGSIDLFNVGVLTQVPIAATGTEFTLAGRFAYTPWLAAAVINGTRGTPGPDLVLGLFDYQARVTQSVGRGSLRLFALGASDDAGLSGPGDVVRLGTAFHRVELRLTHPLGVGEAEAAVTWGQDSLGATGGGDASRVHVGLSERTLGARMAWGAVLSQRLRVGGPGPGDAPARLLPGGRPGVQDGHARAAGGGGVAGHLQPLPDEGDVPLQLRDGEGPAGAQALRPAARDAPLPGHPGALLTVTNHFRALPLRGAPITLGTRGHTHEAGQRGQ